MTAPPASAEPHSELERLRALLLVDERARQQALATEVDQLKQQLSVLPQLLPEAIDTAHHTGQRLSRSLLKPVGQALTTIARQEPQLLVSVLFPVIGPIIRRAIADALTGLVRNLNQTLEHSFSARSWRWRLEAWRTGVPFAQIVLKHTLSWRVEHLLWIEGGSGLLLAHATNSDAPIADRDAIAGMLTAISDFVRDAVLARQGEELERVEMGEFSVRLLRTPEAYLAAVVRGEPAQRVLEDLRALSEELHGQLEPQPRNYSDQAERRLDEWLTRSGHAQAQRDASRRAAGGQPPWRALLLLLGLLVLLGWWGWRGWQLQQRTGVLRAQIEAEPGVDIQALRYDGRILQVRGRRDPLARPDVALAADLGLAPADLHTRWTTHLSMETEMLRRRLAVVLEAPPGVQIESSAQHLRLSGHWPDPPADLETRLDLFRAFVPIDASALQTNPTTPSAPAPLDLPALNVELAALDIPFTGATPGAVAADRIGRLVARIHAELERHPAMRFEAVGDSDGVGSALRNTTLRQQRAAWLRDALITAGAPSAAISVRVIAALGEGERFLPARRAYLQALPPP